MLPCYITSTEKAVPITFIVATDYVKWLSEQNERTEKWLRADIFKADVSTRCLVKDEHGQVERVLLGVENPEDFWAVVSLPRTLPSGNYFFDMPLNPASQERLAIAWGIGTYQFAKYKKQVPITAKLQIKKEINLSYIENFVHSIFMIKDLVNTPTDDMGPADLAAAAEKIAKEFKAEFKQIVGEALVKENYPTIYAVGRASANAPRLIELRWGDKKNPKVTLVGKGVCFDSGGLDLKPADGMLLMKKDMAGAAHCLGLARMIMAQQLPINLRVIIPAVENVVSGNAYHPGDIIRTRKGITVEITNTDAEGRLVLCDALAEAAAEKPDLIIDFATLTGAAHIALGPEIPSLFSPHDDLAHALLKASQEEKDLMWRMPLYKPYRRYLDSPIADMMNSSLGRYAGSITAALFLQEFVDPEIPWAHFDMMAWNPENKNGRVAGAEAMAIRAVFKYLQDKFKR